MKNQLGHLKRVFILLAHGFEEGPLIYCVNQLRQTGIPVQLVSLTEELVSSKHGVSVKGDMLLSELDSAVPKEGLLLFPGGEHATASLLTDPRTHHLIKTINSNNGYMVAMETAVPMLNEFDIPESFACRFIQKCKNQDIIQFSSQLIQQFSN
ncbi:MAG: DJ-1/PfpI family protein [Chloroflexota bacterium]